VSDAVVLAFSFYCDAMPGLVKAFIESLEPYCRRPAVWKGFDIRQKRITAV
jgi:hypothetical protein